MFDEERNPILLLVWCMAHKLALACSDANSTDKNAKTGERVEYISTVVRHLRTLWQTLENSPKKTTAYIKVQKNA